MKEEAARAVLREAWLRGHRCVELQRDGRGNIFVCTRCCTRCYSEAALGDHLRGNLHARRSAIIGEKNSARRVMSEERPIKTRERDRDDDGQLSPAEGSVLRHSRKRGQSQIVWAGTSGVVGLSKSPLEWIGSGELFFSVRSSNSTPVVDSSWFTWKDKGTQIAESGWQGACDGVIAYAVVLFPYSDMIGRGGDWKSPSWSEAKKATNHFIESEDGVSLSQPATNPPICTSEGGTATAIPDHLTFIAPTDNRSIGLQYVSQHGPEQDSHFVHKDGSSRIPRNSCKQKKAKVVERLCFICHQRMNSGRDVAALLNLHTKQMVCGSRNKRGVFHVYHSSCLIDWISICEVKTFTRQLDHRIDRTRKLTRSRRDIVEQSRNYGSQGDGGPFANAISEGAIFCPECQGTGLRLRGAQLERPRYRLAQVFDWMLELIQARKAWTESSRKQVNCHSGLLFREELQQPCSQPIEVQSRGLLHYYSNCANLLTRNALHR